ncbi:hypothetical protein BD779DRAFT_1449911 [Infundibulicybe gibba]|nr:hypothetical protein BD779DRAFT_1449911 [Infundibulicybe gibba]
MHLYLSDTSPLNTTFSDEAGQAIYKVDTPLGLISCTANISRVVRDDIPREGKDLQDRFAHLAQVEWHMFGSSFIRQGGQEIDTRIFFRKEGLGWYGRNHVFMAPNGRDYRWEPGTTPTLVTNDKAKTRVAHFHRKCIFNRRPPSLEIYPGGEEIMDIILITLVYIEKVRKDAENAASRSHKGGHDTVHYW